MNANCANLSAALARLVERTRPVVHATVSAQVKRELIGVAIFQSGRQRDAAGRELSQDAGDFTPR